MPASSGLPWSCGYSAGALALERTAFAGLERLRLCYRAAMSRSAAAEALAENGSMSLAAWAALPEDESGELVDGRIEEEEVAAPAHETVVAWLIYTVYAWLRPRGGLVLGSEAKFAVRPPSRGRKPDVSAFFPGRRMPSRAPVIEMPPDIAIEVVSPTPRDGRRDRIEKLAEYAAFGVRWYWIVDPAFHSFEVFELGADGRYAHTLGATEGEIDPVPGCEGLRLNLTELWAELDRLGPEEQANPESGTGEPIL